MNPATNFSYEPSALSAACSLNQIESIAQLLDGAKIFQEEADKIDIEKHSGIFWECVDKTASILGGYIYHFIAREEYNDFSPHPDRSKRIKSVRDKKAEIYPAIESSADDVWAFCNQKESFPVKLKNLMDGVSRRAQELFFTKECSEREQGVLKTHLESVWENSRKQREITEKLGYNTYMDEKYCIHLTFPDVEALHNHWKCLQAKSPEMNLPDLDVVTSPGIASDLAFVDAYRKHDALLSTGNEFVHDHQVHVTSRILRMMQGQEAYRAERDYIIDIINTVQTIIEEALRKEEPSGRLHREKEKLYFIVGKWADTFFSFSRDDSVAAITIEQVELALTGASPNSHTWDKYLARRFGAGTTADTICELWREVRKLVPLS